MNVQIDAVGVGLASAASPFLPVFLTRLGASTFQVGLLTTMPAITGLFFAIILGRVLQKQKNIVPWFSGARLAVILSYAFTGISVFFIPIEHLANSILIIWAIATIPQTVLNICFSVVMNDIAGPEGRFELMSRRWSILGLTNAITIVAIGQLLDRIVFPLNYQIVFIVLSVGGFISYYFSSRIDLPDQTPVRSEKRISLKKQVQGYFDTISSEKPFISFVLKRWVFMVGATMAVPLLPLFFVRTVHASDGWIAAINTAKTAVMIIGYFFWTSQSRKKGSRLVLLWGVIGLALYPILTAATPELHFLVLYAALAGIFQAAVDLVFFDELMKTIPSHYSAIFVSFAQSTIHFASIIAPFISTFLADAIGLEYALGISGAIQIVGFFLFFFSRKKNPLKEVRSNG